MELPMHSIAAWVRDCMHSSSAFIMRYTMTGANRPLVDPSMWTRYRYTDVIPNQVLATKDLIRLTQSGPFGTITLELMG